MSEPKCLQSSVLTLLFDLLIPKCIGIFLSPSCIYVWNMKAVQNYSAYHVRTEVLTKFRCDLDLWPLTPKGIPVGISLSPSCIYVWNMKAVRWKLVKLSCQNQCWQRSIVTLTFDPKMYRYFSLPNLHLCMKCESCTFKTSEVIVLNQIIDKVQLRPLPLTF